jgi:hypothetical protein
VYFSRRNLPQGYTPRVKGATIVLIDDSTEPWDGALYIDLDPFEVDRDHSVEILFFHIGANEIGGVIVHYVATYTPSGWKVEMSAGDSQTGSAARPDSHLILDHVFADWLTGPNSKDALSYLNGKPLKTVWFDRRDLPKGYTPRVKGVTVSLADGWRDTRDVELFIHVDPFEVDCDSPVEISFFHTGANQVGGATVHYSAGYTPSGWKVEMFSGYSQTDSQTRPDSHVILDRVFVDWLTGRLNDKPLETVWFYRRRLPKGYTPRVKGITIALDDGWRELQEGELYIGLADPLEVDRDSSVEISFSVVLRTGIGSFGSVVDVRYSAAYTPSGWKVEMTDMMERLTP